MASFQTTIALDPTKTQVESICGILRDFNAMANPIFWASLDEPQNQKQPLCVLATHELRQVGGLLANTERKWLKIDILAVEEKHRRQGIGQQLMQQAEATARERGCIYAFVDTMQYQSPAFYHRCGYRTAGQIEDWDSHGHTKFFMVKTLT